MGNTQGLLQALKGMIAARLFVGLKLLAAVGIVTGAMAGFGSTTLFKRAPTPVTEVSEYKDSPSDLAPASKGAGAGRAPASALNLPRTKSAVTTRALNDAPVVFNTSSSENDARIVRDSIGSAARYWEAQGTSIFATPNVSNLSDPTAIHGVTGLTPVATASALVSSPVAPQTSPETSGGSAAVVIQPTTVSGTTDVVADGVSSSTITIVLKNNGVAMSGVTPTFLATGSSNTYGVCSVTDATGASTCTLQSTKAETKTIAITSPAAFASITNTVTFIPGPASQLVVTTAPSTGDTVNTAFSTTPVITVKDANSNTVTDWATDVSITPVSSYTNATTCSGAVVGSLSNASATTANGKLSNGVATFTALKYSNVDTIYFKYASGALSLCGSTAITEADAAAPTISSVASTTGATTFATTVIRLDITASDGTGSGVKQYCYSEGGVCPAANWASFGTGANLPVYSTYVNGPHTLNIWVKDYAGNVSALATFNYTLSFGNAARISSFQVVNSAAPSSPLVPSDNDFNKNVPAQATMFLTWTGTATNGLGANAFTLEYTTGSSLSSWTGISPSFTAGLTPGTATTNIGASITFPVPAAIASTATQFWLRLGIYDQLGQLSYTISPTLNAKLWRYLGGAMSSGLWGSAALSARIKTGWAGNRTHQPLAFDPKTQRVYLVANGAPGYDLTYIDPVTGNWMDAGVKNGATPLTLSYTQTAMALDSVRDVIYVTNSSGITTIRAIKLSDMTYSTFFTGAATSSHCGLAIDATASNLYTCNSDGVNGPLYIDRIPINANGTAGAPVHVVGNGVRNNPSSCTLATYNSNPASCPNALASPFSNAFNSFTGTGVGGSIALSPNGELYFRQDNSATLYRVTKTDGKIVSIGSYSATTMAQGRSGDEILIAGSNQLLAVNGVTGVSTPVAGTGTAGWQGDGMPATSTKIAVGLAPLVTPDGRIFFIDGTDSSLGPYVRVRTIDSAGNLQTIAGTMPSQGNGTSIAAAFFPDSIASCTYNPYDGLVYIPEAYQTRRYNPATGIISLWAGATGGVGTPSGAIATALMPSIVTSWAFSSATQFWANAWNNSNLYGYNSGTDTFTTYAGALSATTPLTGPALSACDGQPLTNCRNNSTNTQGMDFDGNGNMYMIVGGYDNAPNTLNKKILKVYDNAGTLTVRQLMGSNSIAYSADCAGANCARTLPINSTSPGYDANTISRVKWDAISNRVLFVEYNGPNYVLRAINANESLSTIGTLTGFGGASPGAYDGRRYYWYGSGSAIYRMDVLTGTLQNYTPPVSVASSGTGFAACITKPGGDLMFFGSGQFYQTNPDAPSSLLFSAPTRIPTSTCTKVYVMAQDVNGFYAPAPAGGLSVTLSGAGSGAFYSDSGCLSTTTTTTISAGNTTATIYFYDAAVEALTWDASTVGLTPNASLSVNAY